MFKESKHRIKTYENDTEGLCFTPRRPANEAKSLKNLNHLDQCTNLKLKKALLTVAEFRFFNIQC